MLVVKKKKKVAKNPAKQAYFLVPTWNPAHTTLLRGCASYLYISYNHLLSSCSAVLWVCAVLPGHFPHWVGRGSLCTAEWDLTAKEAVVTEESFAPAHPRLRFRTGKCGSNEYPLFPLLHTLTAGSASKSKCKRLNHLVQPGCSCKGRSSGGMLVSPGMPFISAGAVSEASCCLEVVWRVLWGPAHLSSILSIATWIPASALVFCAKAKSRALCTLPRMVRKWVSCSSLALIHRALLPHSQKGHLPTPPRPLQLIPKVLGNTRVWKKTGSILEGSYGEQFFNDGWILAIASLVK